jgi:hypothetical protein
MAFSTALADRIRHSLAGQRGVVSFLLNGNLLVGVWKDSLIVRLGPDEAEAALAEPHVGPFAITGRAMKGWVLVDPEGIGEDAELTGWVQRASEFVRTLPAK